MRSSAVETCVMGISTIGKHKKSVTDGFHGVALNASSVFSPPHVFPGNCSRLNIVKYVPFV